MKQRLEYVDALKGFAILLVVMGHVIAWFFQSYMDVLPLRPSPLQLWHVIYSFHMPLFMFISGYLFGMSHFRTFKEYVVKMKKKAMMILVPWLVSGTLLNLVGGGNSVNNYWYLLTLFQLLVIVGIFNFFIDKIQNTTYQIIAEITMLAITKVLFSLILRSFDISVLHMLNDWYPKLNQMFAYFATGSFLMRHLDISKLLDGRIHSACLLLFCVTTALHKPVAFMAVSLQSVAAIYCSFYMFKVCFTEGKIIDYFKRIGKQTLQIYILHFFFAIKIVQIGNYLTTLVEGGGKQCLTAFVLQLIVSFALSVVIIEMSLLAGKIIKTSNILSRLVLGESASLPHGR